MGTTIHRLPAFSVNALGRSTTLIVAASDSSTNSQDQADYVCDGVDDEVTINQAISDLPASDGRIVLMEGTFILSNSITPNSNVTIEGQGYSTIVKFKNSIAVANTYIFNVNTKTDVQLRYMNLIGNSTNRTSGNQYGVYLNGSDRCIVEYCSFSDFIESPIYLSSADYCKVLFNVINNSYASASRNEIYNSSCNHSIIEGNILIDIPYIGIYDYSSSSSIISSNTINSASAAFGIYVDNSTYSNVNSNEILSASSGIYVINASALYNIIANNILYSCNTALTLANGANYNTVEGNMIVVTNVSSGIYLDSANYNNIVNNYIKDTKGIGIYINSSSHNSILGNTVFGSGTTGVGTSPNISINNNSDYNNVQGNKCSHNGISKYGIYITGATCNNNLVTNNDLYLSGLTASLLDSGTGTVTAAGNRL